MKIAITGASGFIGQCVVEQAIADGHEVLAIVRATFPDHWKQKRNLTIFTCDLTYQQTLANELVGCDAVIHLASQMQGPEMHNKTITATQTVLNAMNQAEVNTLVGMSSISVLNYLNNAPLTLIDEDHELVSDYRTVGPYAQMKRDQEYLFQQWYKQGKSLVTLRPGIVYSAISLAKDHVGFTKGTHAIMVTHPGDVPVVHVDTVASAAVSAATSNLENEVFHLLNDQLPSQKNYVNELKSRKLLNKTFSLPWQIYALLVTLLRFPLSIMNKVPDALRKNSVAARFTPFRFSNEKAKKLLSWKCYNALQDYAD